MAQKILLQIPGTNRLKPAAVGFSWTTFFFQNLVPLFRSDWKMFFTVLLVSSILIAPTANMAYFSIMQNSQNSFVMTSVAGSIWYVLQTIWGIILSIGGGIFYNKMYTKNLIKKGWRPLREADEQLLRQYNIKVPADYELYTPSQHQDQ
ncbi:MAG: hypothetical protein ACRCY4_05530 [Brevinema sp.]